MASLNRLLDVLSRYRNQKLKTGGFLNACLENDLYEAVCRADGDCLDHIRELMQYIANELPTNAWGSKETVEAWLRGE